MEAARFLPRLPMLAPNIPQLERCLTENEEKANDFSLVQQRTNMRKMKRVFTVQQSAVEFITASSGHPPGGAWWPLRF